MRGEEKRGVDKGGEDMGVEDRRGEVMGRDRVRVG